MTPLWDGRPRQRSWSLFRVPMGSPTGELLHELTRTGACLMGSGVLVGGQGRRAVHVDRTHPPQTLTVQLWQHGSNCQTLDLRYIEFIVPARLERLHLEGVVIGLVSIGNIRRLQDQHARTEEAPDLP